ncbi:MAG: geranylgeranyl reductase family protein [Planctomycetota bacterium]
MDHGGVASASWKPTSRPAAEPDALRLEDGSRVAVLGGGPAGTFFAYFLLEMAQRIDLAIEVDIFEPRDFSRPAPHGCNMCGGIISESLVQHLATEGINLPPTVVQRGIEAYELHTDAGSVRIETPQHDMRIGSVYRGMGPRDIKDMRWDSFDGFLQQLACSKGARHIAERVMKVSTEDGKPVVHGGKGEPRRYDLLAVATGVNAGTGKMFEGLDLGYSAPATTKTFIREYQLGEDMIAESLGGAMHVFLLNLPGLEFAAVIPKGDYVSVCLLGDEITDELVQSFLADASVRGCFPADWNFTAQSCQCSPRIAVAGASQPFGDRVVFVGDCAETRLYKDGIGAAYRTSKLAARTAVFDGISAAAFEKHYAPLLQEIRRDNRAGAFTFWVTRIIQKLAFARRAIVRMTAREQSRAGNRRRMSGVLWDMFTGSASYTSVFLRTLHPVFIAQLVWNLGCALVPARKTKHG